MTSKMQEKKLGSSPKSNDDTKQAASDSIPTANDLAAMPKVHDDKPVEQPVSSLGLPNSALSLAAPATGITSSMFAPENLRVSQDFVELANVEQIIGTIPVRKPGKQEFFRVRPGDEWQLPVAVIEDGEDRELWIVAPGLVPEVADEINCVLLRLAVSRYGVPFLWPLKVSKDGKSNPWNQSAMVAAENATTKWVRMRSDQAAGQYKIMAAKNDLTEPEWPDMTFQKILELAFKDRIITDYNHPFLKLLRGEA